MLGRSPSKGSLSAPAAASGGQIQAQHPAMSSKCSAGVLGSTQPPGGSLKSSISSSALSSGWSIGSKQEVRFVSCLQIQTCSEFCVHMLLPVPISSPVLACTQPKNPLAVLMHRPTKPRRVCPVPRTCRRQQAGRPAHWLWHPVCPQHTASTHSAHRSATRPHPCPVTPAAQSVRPNCKARHLTWTQTSATCQEKNWCN